MSSVKCEDCQVGRCQPMAMTYMRNLGPRMVVLPNAPANKCDMCGRVNFDPGFLSMMQSILEELIEDRQQDGRDKSPIADRHQGWTPVGKGS